MSHLGGPWGREEGGSESLARLTHIVSLRAAVLATFAGNDIFLAGLGMDAFVLQADHALACL